MSKTIVHPITSTKLFVHKHKTLIVTTLAFAAGYATVTVVNKYMQPDITVDLGGSE